MDKEMKSIDPVGSDFDEHLESELKDPEMAAYFINAAIEEHDANYLKVALGKVVRLHGVTEISKIAGLNRESIYKMLSLDGNPGFENILQILNACGLEIAVHPKGQIGAKAQDAQLTYVLKSDLKNMISEIAETTARAYVRLNKTRPKAKSLPRDTEIANLKKLANETYRMKSRAKSSKATGKRVTKKS